MLFIMLVTILGGCKSQNVSLQKDIFSYLDENMQEKTCVKISDFTQFEWDTLLIFRYPITQKEIEEAIGVRYEGSLDLTSGMIFVLNNEVVYDEIFKNAYTALTPLLIYPYEDINYSKKYAAFSPDTAIFECEKVTSGEMYGYRLYPCKMN
ncbi:Uncharacterised protein [uncultured Clostridium sp.]|nr:Uncharacterised protein [uncultured Clostridium sp.]